jgi:uncharacterized integral membrane protein
VLIFLATLFLIQNTQVVDINVLVWTYSMSASIIVVSMLLLGVLIGWFLKSYVAYKTKKVTDIVEENIE